jgi:arginyl-tRNA synthetase
MIIKIKLIKKLIKYTESLENIISNIEKNIFTHFLLDFSDHNFPNVLHLERLGERNIKVFF